MDNGVLKYICLWMVLLLLFFLLLYGVHQFFFSRMESRITTMFSLLFEIPFLKRMESRITKKTSLFEPAMKNTSVKKVDESPYYKPTLENNTLTI